MSGSLDDQLEALSRAAARLPGTVPDAEAVTKAQRQALWAELDRRLGEVTGRRVIVVGEQVADDVAGFVARGADNVLSWDGVDPDGLDGSAPLASAIRPARCNSLDSGAFDVVFCEGLLHRTLEPMRLLLRLRDLSASGAQLIVAGMVLADVERAEYLRFVPDGYAGDPTWRQIPGRLALRWMLYAAGFEVLDEFGEQEGPRDAPPVVQLYVHAVAAQPGQ